MPAPAYPLLVDLEGQRALVVGAGRVATRKIRRLLASGLEVRVVSPEATDEIAAWAEEEQLSLELRGAREDDLEGARLAFLTSDQPELNDRLMEAARERGILANRADQPGGGDFQVPGEARRGDVRVFLSTSGRSPALARLLRQRIEEVLEEDWEGYLEVFETLRHRLQEEEPDPARRSAFWRGFPTPEAWRALREGRSEDLEQEVRRCVSSL